jgi:hypothetical protein
MPPRMMVNTSIPRSLPSPSGAKCHHPLPSRASSTGTAAPTTTGTTATTPPTSARSTTTVITVTLLVLRNLCDTCCWIAFQATSRCAKAKGTRFTNILETDNRKASNTIPTREAEALSHHILTFPSECDLAQCSRVRHIAGRHIINIIAGYDVLSNRCAAAWRLDILVKNSPKFQEHATTVG